MMIFDLSHTPSFGRDVAQVAGYPLAPHEMRAFGGGQHKARPLISVRGVDVFVLAGLHAVPGASVNDNLMCLLFFLATCRDHGAARVTAIVPWMPYSRKDRVTKARDPVSSRYMAQLFEAVGTDTLITVDVHNLAAFQNGCRCRTIHLDTCKLFSAHINGATKDAGITIMSPDCGGVKRADLLRQSLELVRNKPVGFAFMEKRRSAGVVSGDLFAGDVAGQDVWIVDDIIESGETMLRAAKACRDRGAHSVHLLATHAFCNPQAADTLIRACDSLTVTDAADVLPDPRHGTLSVAPMIGQILARMHNRQPVSPVLDPTGMGR
jgi:ribose-phosphate pyrophosphokinase